MAGGALGVLAVFKLHLLKAYQLGRLTAFLHPDADPQGSGYSAAQAKIAIGSGGVFGQGLFHGQLIAGNFVPEQHTDFIFAVAGKELGFVGAAVIIALLALLLLRALRIAARADDQFGMLVASGVAIWFAVQSFINIGMTIGIMPVTGPAAAVRVLWRLGHVRRHDRDRRAAEPCTATTPSSASLTAPRRL